MAPAVARIDWKRAVGLAAGPALLAGGLVITPAAQAGPVVCTTTLEAPPTTARSRQPGAPVEVTRCGSVQSVPDLMERRFYSYRAPFARGIDITHQITDILGIAMGGGDGTRVMGFGFPDQAIVWDGSAVQNTYQVLLEEQSNPLPWRTGDVASGFSSSLGSGGGSAMAAPWQDPAASYGRPVRGLW